MSPSLKSAQPGRWPGRKRVSPASAREEEHFLPRRENPLAEYFRENLRQPRAAGEHEARRAQRSRRRTSGSSRTMHRASAAGSQPGDTRRRRPRTPAPASAPRAAPSARRGRARTDRARRHPSAICGKRFASAARSSTSSGMPGALMHLDALRRRTARGVRRKTQPPLDGRSAGPNGPTATAIRPMIPRRIACRFRRGRRRCGVMRDSPPEEARACAGPQASSSSTLRPSLSRCHAVQAPNTPAPTTITSRRPDCTAGPRCSPRSAASDFTDEVPAAAAMPARSVRREKCKELGILSFSGRFRCSYRAGDNHSPGSGVTQ